MTLGHLSSRLLSAPLAIRADKLRDIVRVVGHRLGLDVPRAGGLELELNEHQGASTTATGIAVLTISGTLMARTFGIGALSGLSGYGEIRAALDEAVADPNVRGVLLDVDSFGGEVQGVFDLADRIKAAAKKKPVWAVANHNAYSAAYLLASAADKVYVSRAGGVGSIGVVAIHTDKSGALEQAGIKPTYVFAGDKKVDGNPTEPLSARARADLQAEVDALYGMFVEAVGAHGRVSADQARATQAGTFTGQAAVDAGLADKVGTVDDALADLEAHVNRARRRAARSPFRRSA